MNKYTKRKSFVFTFLLVAATILTKAQNAPDSAKHYVNNFGEVYDIVEISYTGIGTHGEGAITDINDVFVFLTRGHFSMALNIGVESSVNNSSISWPLSGDFRWYFTPGKKVSPFLDFYSGFYFKNFEAMDDNNDVVLAGLNFGVNIVETHNVSLQLALGFKLQHYGYFVADYPEHYSPSAYPTYLSVPFTLGVEF